MKCEEFHAMKGAGMKNVTPSLLLAVLRHMKECPACKKAGDDNLAEKSPQELAAYEAVTVAVLPSLLRAAVADPEAMP